MHTVLCSTDLQHDVIVTVAAKHTLTFTPSDRPALYQWHNKNTIPRRLDARGMEVLPHDECTHTTFEAHMESSRVVK